MTPRSLREDFFRSLGGSAGLYIFGAGIGFLVGVQLARGLGVAGYGLYGSAMAAATLGATAASGGLQLHATREIAASLARDASEAPTSLVVWSIQNLIMLGIAAGVFVASYVFWGLDAGLFLATATGTLTILMSLLWLAGAIVRGSGAVVLGQAMDVALRPSFQCGLLLSATLLFGVIDPVLAISLSCLAIILALPFGWPLASRLLGSSSQLASGVQRNGWRRASAVMGFTTIVRATEEALPLMVIGLASTMEGAGLFRVAIAVTTFLSMPSSMISVMVPAMAYSLYERKEMDRLAVLSTVAGLAMFLPTVVLAVVFWTYGDVLLVLAFGEDYRGAWSSLAVLSLGAVIWSLSGVSVCLLHSAKRDLLVSQAFVLSLFVTTIGVVLAGCDGRAEVFAVAILLGIVAKTSFLLLMVWRALGVAPAIVGASNLAYKVLLRGGR